MIIEIKKPVIIGISGKIGSGKSFIARHIQNNLLEYKFEYKSFSYEVKKIASYLTGVNMKTVVSRKAKPMYLPEWDMTLCEMFQKIGTDCMRNNLHADTWVLSMFSKHTDQNFIIDDVRFINEADSIKSRGGILIRLDGDPKDIRKNDPRDMDHISETQLDDYRGFYIIYDNNLNSDLNDLLQLIKLKI